MPFALRALRDVDAEPPVELRRTGISMTITPTMYSWSPIAPLAMSTRRAWFRSLRQTSSEQNSFANTFRKQIGVEKKWSSASRCSHNSSHCS